MAWYKNETLEKVGFYRMALRFSQAPTPIRRLLWWSTLNISGYKRCKRFGTFGLSSYGALGAEQIHPISPLTTTLTYGPIDPATGRVVVKLIYDHRVLDGAYIARRLRDIEEVMNGPILDELLDDRPVAGAERLDRTAAQRRAALETPSSRSRTALADLRTGTRRGGLKPASSPLNRTRPAALPVQRHRFASFLVGRDPHFEPAHHLLERLFLGADEQHVVEHQRLGHVGDVEHQPARTEQRPLEDVGDLLVELQVHGRIPLEVARAARGGAGSRWARLPSSPASA